ncbi:hypothetical protein CBS115989_9624 [Aspergillus niger]|uniref:Contig An10c0050, genomic contig n=4 Tax=Aspergillus niger TaxID=5061 RepID=A2QV11_ASPNC|nr:uncharacterized protein BO96DRAFT_403883 [Aspergillus niger CBS 101883]XP_059601497.1 uncharacterized protein An10g00590 [Aspergillus niger]EHA22233.1 hypothetical protein ASPNIDRAFT_45000 [Aspergillus niger ATCC 1015]RDH15203.1 hypothetical protein M747DRAFT_299675 [Aspergillus niger ATCC 13496]KAI2813263.1 hypothetical protein CBS115989_9624 [Aspergillus niger]KAI2839149.1 hypothetical protein CBS11232_9447 [Aspergillus niger]KAI2866966.1 hypothetical protein CBS12448_839 [Aspergillus ni
MSRPVSPATSIGTHISGISHPPGSRKRRRISVLNGISGDELLNRISDWDDGQKSASSISHTSRSSLSLSAISPATPKEDNKATRVPAPSVLVDPLPRGHLDDPFDWYEDIEEAQVPTELDKLRNDYQAELKASHSRIARLVRQINVLQGNIRLQAAEIRFLREQRDHFRDMQSNSNADPKLRSNWDSEQQQELIQLQAEQVQSLTAERDYYRHERDYYRDRIPRLTSLTGSPPPLPRPLSPYDPKTSVLPASLKSSGHQDKAEGDFVERSSMSLHSPQKRKRDTAIEEDYIV